MRLLLSLLVLSFAVGCAGTRFKLDQSYQNYGLSTSELLVLNTVDEALNKIERKIGEEGLPQGKTASLEILGVYSPTHLHPYIRRLVEARLANHGLKIVKERKLVRAGSRYYQDSDFEYWSSDVTKSMKADTGDMKSRLLAGAAAALKPEEGNLPDLRIVLALKIAGVDVFLRDIFVFSEESLTCRVDAKLYVFSQGKVKIYEGKSESPRYVYKRRILKYIPLPAPYKELETDRRSLLRKLLDGITGSRQAVQVIMTPPPGTGPAGM